MSLQASNACAGDCNTARKVYRGLGHLAEWRQTAHLQGSWRAEGLGATLAAGLLPRRWFCWRQWLWRRLGFEVSCVSDTWVPIPTTLLFLHSAQIKAFSSASFSVHCDWEADFGWLTNTNVKTTYQFPLSSACNILPYSVFFSSAEVTMQLPLLA